MNMFIIVVLTLGSLTGRNRGSHQAPAEHVLREPSADITLTLVSSFPAEGRALGLYMIEETAVLGVNNTDMRVNFYAPSTGTVTAIMDLDPANTSCFGVSFDPDAPGAEHFYTNDWGGNDLFYTINWGASWSTVFDPSFNEGRGMDFHGGYHWTTEGYQNIIRFLPEYTPFDVLSVPETTGQLSGITVFPWEGDLGVAVTSYGAQGIWFYIWNGAALDYLGYAQFPITPNESYGLAHSEDLDCIFWSYTDSSENFHIARLVFEISQAFTQNTWGGIKTAF